jgi:hypothetical protein
MAPCAIWFALDDLKGLYASRDAQINPALHDVQQAPARVCSAEPASLDVSTLVAVPLCRVACILAKVSFRGQAVMGLSNRGSFL